MSPALRDTLISLATAFVGALAVVIPAAAKWLAAALDRRTQATREHTSAVIDQAAATREHAAVLRGPAVERQLHQQHKSKP